MLGRTFYILAALTLVPLPLIAGAGASTVVWAFAFRCAAVLFFIGYLCSAGRRAAEAIEDMEARRRGRHF